MKRFFTTFAVVTMSIVANMSVLSHAMGEETWNQFRGTNRVGHSAAIGILKSWPEGGPKLLGRVDNIGAGYSNFSFWGDGRNGLMFSMGDIEGKSCVFALAQKDGKMVWKTVVGSDGGGGGYQGPRCTPPTNGKLVAALNQHGDILVVQAANGNEVWRRNLKRDFGGDMMSGWGYSESPLLLGNLLVLVPGGSNGAVLALDFATGREVWRCTELTDKAAYTSVVPSTIDGKKVLLVLTGESLAAVSPENGKLLWKAPFPGRTAVCSDPVTIGDTVFAACAYGVGGVGYKATANSVEQTFANNRLESHHGGMVAVGEYVYFLTNRELECLDPKSGETLWTDRSVGKGSITYVDGHLVVRSEGKSGTVALVEANPKGYVEKGRFDQPDRSEKNSWTHPTVVGDRLYLRDQNVLFVYQVK